jgi:hypothetical protein
MAGIMVEMLLMALTDTQEALRRWLCRNDRRNRFNHDRFAYQNCRKPLTNT